MGHADMRLALVAFALAVSSTVAACGYMSTGTTQAITVQTITTQTITTVACQSPTAGASAARSHGQPLRVAWRALPITTLPPAVSLGQVRVEVEGDQHRPCDTIFLWVGNGLSESIYTTDHHSDCTIVTLQRQVDGGWQPMANCLLASPTRIVALPSMQADFVQLAPGALGTQERAWPTGTYRAAFGYHTSQAASAAADTVVYSPTFSLQ